MSYNYPQNIFMHNYLSIFGVKPETNFNQNACMYQGFHPDYLQAMAAHHDNSANSTLFPGSVCTSDQGFFQSSPKSRRDERNTFPSEFGANENLPARMPLGVTQPLITIPGIPELFSIPSPRQPLRDLKLSNQNISTMSDISICADSDHGYVSPSDLSPLTDSTCSASSLSNSTENIQLSISDIIDGVLELEESNLETKPTVDKAIESLNRHDDIKPDRSLGVVFEGKSSVSKSTNEVSSTVTTDNSGAKRNASEDRMTELNNGRQIAFEQPYQVSPTTFYSCFQQPSQVHQDQFSDHTCPVPSRIQCLICGKYFQTKNNLKIHFKCHTGERPYACTYCDKRFTQKSILRTHIRTHTGEKPYTCEYCTRAFSDCSTYRKHLRVHTGERPYVCDVCMRAFAQSGNLIRHREIHFKSERKSNI